jgi:hypothetical protein
MQTSDTAVCDDPLAAFYTDALTLLEASGIPFLLGGSFALARYTNLDRHTKDLDVFVRPSDLARTLGLFDAEGYETELTFPHWLAKIKRGMSVIDVIFSSGNGVARVDDEWFAHAAEGVVLGRRVQLCPPEELVWSKAFVLERERFDGADVAHLLREAGREIDWRRLLARFGSRWPVLFSHLTLFFFIYPDQRDVVPAGLMEELAGRLTRLTVEPDNHVCFGTLLSREQYLSDLERHGYLDARVSPHGSMTPDEVRVWTDAIDKH